MEFKEGDRVRVKPTTDHWSAGELGTVVAVVDEIGSGYPVRVELDRDRSRYRVLCRANELEPAR